MHKKYVLMSIKPQYAQSIKSGEKTVELRRVAPKVAAGDIIVIYESKPVQRITAFCEVSSILSMEPQDLWKTVCRKVCISKDAFDQYFLGKQYANGIELKNLSILKNPKTMRDLSWNIHPPQSYRYISLTQFKALSTNGHSS